MVTRFFILFLSALAVWAVPRAKNKEQLQRLIRLPKIEFAPPVEFDRSVGFLIFPDPSDFSSQAAELTTGVKGPEGAAKYLEAGKLYDLARNHPMALREYVRGLDSLRKKVELYPGDADSILDLAGTFVALGRFSEAEAQLTKVSAASREKAKYHLVKAQFHRERAWDLVTDEQNALENPRFIDELLRVIKRGLQPEKMQESKAHLVLAEGAFDKALELKSDDPDLLRERAGFISFREALTEGFRLMQSDDSNKRRRLREKLFSEEAIAAMRRAADLKGADADLIGSAAVAFFFQLAGESKNWVVLGDGEQLEIRKYLNRLQVLSESENSKTASEAAEVLGCLQFYLLGDSLGGERSFRKSLSLDNKRGRSWDMLIVCLGVGENESALVEVCEERASNEANARTKTLLAKAYDRAGDSLHAQLSALEAVLLNSDDFSANLALASLLLKRDDFEVFTTRAREYLSKAQRQIGLNSSAQNYIDLALTKAIFYAMTDEEDKA